MNYGDRVLDHFRSPRNIGEMPSPDGLGDFGDPGCGDTFRIYIRVRQGRIDEISFQVQGCPAAIACGSALTEMARGRTLDEALKITNEDVLRALGGLPDPKEHCSNLGAEALHRAVFDYLLRLVPGTPLTFWVRAIGEVTRVAEVSSAAPAGFPRLSEIALFPRFVPLLDGWEAETHLWVAYRISVGATAPDDRSPNPIGWSLVRLVGFQADRLLVDGLDAARGASIIYLRPWSPRDQRTGP